MRLEAGLKLSLSILLLLVGGALPNMQAWAQGIDTGPPTLGEWYKPPEFVVTRRIQTQARVSEFVPNSKEKRLLAVSEQDLHQHAATLSQPNTGAFRLLPYYPLTRVVSANSPEIEWRRGFSAFASSWSFTKNKHGHGMNGKGDSYFGWADLRLRDGIFTAGIMGESLGLMVPLGDVPLDDVTPQTAGVAEVAELVSPPTNTEAFALFGRNLRGYQRNGFTYGSRLFAQVNCTYVLRSMLNLRADQLIAFRVVRLSDDEGLTIVWKKLQDYPKPAWITARRK